MNENIMENKIEKGDMVWIRYCELILDYQGMVVHVPQDVGDMWYIQTKTEIIAVNPICSILIGIYKAQ
jgi:hypothetical protein